MKIGTSNDTANLPSISESVNHKSPQIEKLCAENQETVNFKHIETFSDSEV